jgi:hypothetical protein
MRGWPATGGDKFPMLDATAALLAAGKRFVFNAAKTAP